MKDCLNNYNNYGIYSEFVKGRNSKTNKLIVDTSTINSISWHDHFNWILNILRDGVETDFVKKSFITIDFGNDKCADLTITDYFTNLLMWYLIVKTGTPIEPKHIFFDENITSKSIKKYIDTFFILKHREHFEPVTMNMIIDDALQNFYFINEFAMYLADTVNLEDDIDLANACPEYNDLLHMDFSDVLIEDIQNKATYYTNRAIELIKNSKMFIGRDHCLTDSFRSMEGINPRQFREVNIGILTKPDGRGSVHPYIINNSFINGGTKDPVSYSIESGIGRIAQILSKNNVSDSGHFARLIGLNNMDTILFPDPNYVCNTKNFQQLYIKNEKILKMVKDSFYRLDPNVYIEKVVHEDDVHLIGKNIFLRSPMTCASYASGQGICYRCYGKLAFIIKNINIGKIAAEILSALLTQKLLSAKHLLEAAAKKIKWNESFYGIFEVEYNFIKLIEDNNYKGWFLEIDPDDIILENEDDYKKSDYDDSEVSGDGYNENYNEFLTSFDIITPDGRTFKIDSANSDNMYISVELNNIIRYGANSMDGKLRVSLSDLNDGTPLFFIRIMNTELSETLERLMNILDKKSITTALDRNQILQLFIETLIEGGLDISAKHCEVILSNQIRNYNDILEHPQWEYPNEPYTLLTLNDSLTSHPSVSVSLSYQRLSKLLYSPLTFRKYKSSFIDLFFMEKPQNFLTSTPIEKSDIKEEKQLMMPFTIMPNEIDPEGG